MDESSNFEVFKNLIRRSSKVLFSFDVESASITFLNNSFSQIWRRTRESVLAKPAILLDTVHPDDREYVEKTYSDLLEGILKPSVEFRIVLPDKSVSWLLVNPQLVIDNQNRRFIAGIAEDITTQKDNYNVLERFAAKKNSVLEILAHDLAGPLANIQNMADLLAEGTKDNVSPETTHIIHLIRESSARNICLIRDLVQQEFLESANAGMVKRRVNLCGKIKEVIDQYKESEAHINKTFTFTATNNKFFACIDDAKFMQVINNLISNAIKFTRDDGHISIHLSDQQDTVFITLKDNGIGIPLKYHDELFEKFTKARREGLRGEPSTGLGMSIIKTIIEWHNGKIWFESEENVGTTFFIELPKE
ncbi:PAS domain-containing protein [Pontibacter sp. KCTC 32443]|uniref:PAS domain-containing sensor histidine kinase n=1 Tax=Pontibacter TaxID=323449 RepID=UPI00164E8830|nr:MULTISPECIES: PAS domain-containing sensor histidine kinase [Pontibacter]MBC5773113.1 PAS domain-containing protein [Pontibacter sp. KCTC 32443]